MNVGPGAFAVLSALLAPAADNAKPATTAVPTTPTAAAARLDSLLRQEIPYAAKTPPHKIGDELFLRLTYYLL